MMGMKRKIKVYINIKKGIIQVPAKTKVVKG